LIAEADDALTAILVLLTFLTRAPTAGLPSGCEEAIGGSCPRHQLICGRPRTGATQPSAVLQQSPARSERNRHSESVLPRSPSDRE
jgi:hypothetical protein